jgi:hypothetical protein
MTHSGHTHCKTAIVKKSILKSILHFENVMSAKERDRESYRNHNKEITSAFRSNASNQLTAHSIKVKQRKAFSSSDFFFLSFFLLTLHPESYLHHT